MTNILPLNKDDNLASWQRWHLKSVSNFLWNTLWTPIGFSATWFFSRKPRVWNLKHPPNDKCSSYLGKYQDLAWQIYNFLPKEIWIWNWTNPSLLVASRRLLREATVSCTYYAALCEPFSHHQVKKRRFTNGHFHHHHHHWPRPHRYNFIAVIIFRDVELSLLSSLLSSSS